MEKMQGGVDEIESGAACSALPLAVRRESEENHEQRWRPSQLRSRSWVGKKRSKFEKYRVAWWNLRKRDAISG